MRYTSKNNFKINLNESRSSGEAIELTSLADYEVWKNISKYYSVVEFSTLSKELVRIEVDWSPAVEKAKRNYMLHHKSTDAKLSVSKLPKSCNAVVEVNSKFNRSEKWHGDDYLKHFLYEIYLISNLSTPGSFNLYRSTIEVPGLNHKNVFAFTELELSEFPFENALNESFKKSYLSVEIIPFYSVLNWYKKLNINLKQLAETNIEKVLFSILHLGKNEFIEDQASLWLSSAIEAIVGSPSGNNIKTVKDRISKILDFNEKQRKYFNKNIDIFYSIRSSFIHGGGNILHPMFNEVWDNNVTEKTYRNLDSNAFAFEVLLSLVQNLIRNGASSYEFHEKVGLVAQSNC